MSETKNGLVLGKIQILKQKNQFNKKIYEMKKLPGFGKLIDTYSKRILKQFVGKIF
jgi:hypothetical protein